MRWTPAGRSRNLEDRRAQRPMYRRPAPIGCGGLVFTLLISYLFGVNPLTLLDTGTGVSGVDVGIPAASEPFYCPADEKVNIDLSFYQ